MAQQIAISRRRFVQTTAASSLALAGMGVGGPTWAQSTKPNIVFILADDLGWRDTSVYGSTYYRRPNVARLAEQGRVFTNAYSANPLCSPTRASLMTGQYPARVRITTPQAMRLPALPSGWVR